MTETPAVVEEEKKAEAEEVVAADEVAAEKTNSLTGERYYWALVDSLGGSFDVVIDPTICEAAPEAGGVLSGSFWLCGRLLPLE